jgi:hypothetical protein
MISFNTSTRHTFKIVVSTDSSVQMTEEQKKNYFNTGNLDDIQVDQNASWFTLRTLSIADREQAEIKAGAFTRSELGKLLWVEAPNDTRDKAVWHNRLSDEEKEALAKYEKYLDRSYLEYAKASLVAINDEEVNSDILDNLSPADKSNVIYEMVIHLTRESTLSEAGK